MDSDPDAGLLGDGHDLADEIGVVLPELFLGELAAVTQRRLEHLAGPVPLGRLQPERARRRAASGRLALGAPDAVPHVRVGRVVDPGSGEVAQVLLVLLDLGIAAGEVQGDLGHVVDVRISDVGGLQAGRFDASLETGERLVGPAGRRYRDVLDADLTGECEIVVGEVRRDLKRDLDPRGERIESPLCA